MSENHNSKFDKNTENKVNEKELTKEMNVSNTPHEEKEKVKHRNKKIERFANLSKEIKEKISILTRQEEDLLEKSGYNKWKKEFIIGYLSYSLITFIGLKYVAKISNFNNIHLSLLFFPSFPMGYILIKKNVDIPTYKQYYNTHIELNRLISIHINNKS